jgi:hypothetical protein
MKVKRTVTTIINVPIYGKNYDDAFKAGQREVDKDNFDFSGGETEIEQAKFHGLFKAKKFVLLCDWVQNQEDLNRFTVEEILTNKCKEVDFVSVYGKNIRSDIEGLEVGQCTFWREPFNGMVCCLRME